MTAAEQQGDSCAGYTDTFLKVNVKKKVNGGGGSKKNSTCR